MIGEAVALAIWNTRLGEAPETLLNLIPLKKIKKHQPLKSPMRRRLKERRPREKKPKIRTLKNLTTALFQAL